MELTDEQLHTLRHMLGINTPRDRVPRPYRNYAAVQPGDPEFAELERLGAVRRYRQASGACCYDYYECTEQGRVAAMNSHRLIRVSKSKRVYARYLDVSDVYCDLTFKQFLISPEFADIRRTA